MIAYRPRDVGLAHRQFCLGIGFNQPAGYWGVDFVPSWLLPEGGEVDLEGDTLWFRRIQ